MNKLGLAMAAAAVLGVLIGSSTVAIAEEQVQLSGTITVNSESPPVGVGIIARLQDGTDCGRTTTEEGGAYQLVISPDCPAGEVVRFFLAATGDQAATEATIAKEDRTEDIAFEGLSAESLQAIGAAVPGAEVVEKAAEEALKEKFEASLLSQTATFVTLLAIVAVAGVLIAAMVGAQMWTVLQGGSPDLLSFWRQLEATVLVMVIVAVIILGITDKVQEQGLVAILGAISGYGAGRVMGAAAGGRE